MATRKLPSRLLAHGPPGVGKTSFAAHAPGVIFPLFTDETGIETLIDAGQLPPVAHTPEPVATWDHLLSMLDVLAEEPHDYRTLAIDTIGSAERLCHEHVCAESFNGDWGERGFVGYRRGYLASLTPWRLLLAKLDRLRAEKRMAVVLLAHTRVNSFRNPNGPDYDRFEPDLAKETWQVTAKWADIVLFADYHTEVIEEGNRKKGRGGTRRVFYTTHTATYEAKNRHGLPEEIEMGESGKEAWANFLAAIKAANGNGRKEG